MALIRCMDHRPDDGAEWVAAIEPVGYPETAVLCSYRGHANPEPGLVFLSPDEYEFYQLGKRIFSPPGTATQIQVADDPVTTPDPDVESSTDT